MFNSIELIRLAQCAKKAKLALLDDISYFIKLLVLSRKEGLLSLEVELPLISHNFLKENLQRVINGFDPDELKNIMFVTIVSHNIKGRELLHHLLIATAILSISKGSNPQSLYCQLVSFLGKDYIELKPMLDAKLDQVKNVETPSRELYDDIFQWVFNQRKKIKMKTSNQSLENIIENINPFSFDRLVIHYSPLRYFTYSIPIIDNSALEKILNNLSQITLYQIWNFISQNPKPSFRDMQDSYFILLEKWESNVRDGLI